MDTTLGNHEDVTNYGSTQGCVNWKGWYEMKS